MAEDDANRETTMTARTNKMSPTRTTSGRILLPALTLGMVLFAVAGAVLVFKRTSSLQPAASSTNAPPFGNSRATAPVDGGVKLVRQRAASPRVTVAQGSPDSAQVPQPVQPSPPPVSRTLDSNDPAQRLLTSLTQLDLKDGAITKEQTEGFRQRLKQLAEQGAAAIPAIRDFLGRNEDISFAALKGGEAVGYSSLRTALFDALQQIGGPEAAELSAATLKTTSVPMEVAVLTRSLEQMAPAQYRELELTSARELLAMANTDQWKGGDAGALFEVLQKFGDASVVPDLMKSISRWKYYATVSLAGLPDEAGIPALIQLARDPAVTAMGKGDGALRILAQVSLQNTDARSALVEQARAGQIPNTAWPAVVSALSGTYLQYGSRIFGNTATDVTWSNEEVTQRLALVDQVIASTKDPTASQLLQSARSSIALRLKK